MRHLAVFIGLAVFTFFMSCEKCKRCSYTYSETVIQQTINGEEEVVHNYTGYIVVDSVQFDSECIKGDEEFTIDAMYMAKGDTTVLENYEYNCIDL